MKSNITYNKLKKKAETLSLFLSYNLIVEKDSDYVWLVADNGMKGSEVIVIGTLEECFMFIEELEKDYI